MLVEKTDWKCQSGFLFCCPLAGFKQEIAMLTRVILFFSFIFSFFQLN